MEHGHTNLTMAGKVFSQKKRTV